MQFPRPDACGLQGILRSFQYYWVTTQSEYSTDIRFKSRENLCELHPQLQSHSIPCFGAKEVMNFLGRKLNGNFQGEVVSELSSFVCRRTGGSRIKHRVKENWLKMYDKAGLVLRKVSRIFRRFHAHGLIAKLPRTRRWRVTLYGRRVMGIAPYLREHDFARAYAKMAA